MSRALNIKTTEEKLISMCATLKIGFSVMEPLQSGGTRIVLNNSDDAATLKRKLKTDIIEGPVTRSATYVSRKVIPYS